VVGGIGYEKWTSHLGGVRGRRGIAVPVYVCPFCHGYATVLGLVLSNGKPLEEVSYVQ